MNTILIDSRFNKHVESLVDPSVTLIREMETFELLDLNVQYFMELP